MWFEFALPPLVTMTFGAVILLSIAELVRSRIARRREAEARVKLTHQQRSR